MPSNPHSSIAPRGGTTESISSSQRVNPTDLSVSVQLALKQAQTQASAQQWAQVIALCEGVVDQCRQYLSSPTGNPSGRPTDPTAKATEHRTAALYQAKGELFQQQGNLEAAIEAYQQAVACQPDRVDLHLRIARLCHQTQQLETAIIHYEKAQALSPNQPDITQQLAQLYLHRGHRFKQQSHLPEAVDAYLKALRQNPRLFEAYSRLRYNLMRYAIPAGDPMLEQVVQTCRDILEKHPDLRYAGVTLGYALTKLGNVYEATRCFRRLSQDILHDYDPGSALPSSFQNHAPDFIIIGAEKCGTTSLHQYICQHPAVVPPVEKEIDFFDLEYERGLDWYLAHFPPIHPEAQQISGETSANYFYNDGAPRRIFQHFPNTKLILILRNPVDRTISRYNMMVRNGAEVRDFETAIREEMERIQQAMEGDTIPWWVLNQCRHLGNSLYYYHLRRWLGVFPRQQLLIVRSEDLFTRPESTLTSIYRTLGLNDFPDQTYPKLNAGSYSPIEAKTRQGLTEFFAPHTQKLESLLNQSFNWQIDE